MGRLTTHVLDSAQGIPAHGVRVDLLRCVSEDRYEPMGSFETNADGRVDTPLLEGDQMRSGTYELRFHAGDYLRDKGVSLPEPAFLDVVPLRFGIADEGGHYHVPLLLSPFGYTTYRGS